MRKNEEKNYWNDDDRHEKYWFNTEEDNHIGQIGMENDC